MAITYTGSRDRPADGLPTYLLTYRGGSDQDFTRGLDNLVAQSRQHVLRRPAWGAGNSKGIQPGDRIFLVAQGRDDGRVMGSGIATAPAVVSPHYLPEKAGLGETAVTVDIALTELLPRAQGMALENFFSAAGVKERHVMYSSGQMLPAQGADGAEAAWQGHIAGLKDPAPVHLVEDSQEISFNITHFHRLLSLYLTQRDGRMGKKFSHLVAGVHYFVRDATTGLMAPARYCGVSGIHPSSYQNMTSSAQTHPARQIHGKPCEKRIQELTGAKFVKDGEAQAYWSEFVERTFGLSPREMARNYTPGKLHVLTFAGPGPTASPLAPPEQPKLSKVGDSSSPAPQGDLSMSNNIILAGPPGTSKTFDAKAYAVCFCQGMTHPQATAVIASLTPQGRKEIEEQYASLHEENRVEMVTFHPSFSYEEFIEGLRPCLSHGPHPDGSPLSFEITRGVFRRFCEGDGDPRRAPFLSGAARRPRWWKLSLGAVRSPQDAEVFDICREGNFVAMGFGDGVDFSGCEGIEAIEERASTSAENSDKTETIISMIHRFKNELKTGDWVFISNGNKYIRGLAEVTGDYFHSQGDRFSQRRRVNWLWSNEPGMNAKEVSKVGISQQTLYEIKPTNINQAALNFMLDLPRTEKVPAQNGAAEPRCFIIDEINRANVPKVMGDILTLIEPSKRGGQAHAIAVTLPYSREPFTIPKNVHIVATMNSEDRSIQALDAALRRRFDFIEKRPDAGVIASIFSSRPALAAAAAVPFLDALNDRILQELGEEYVLGHAWFLDAEDMAQLRNIFAFKIIPLLRQQADGQWVKVARILNCHQRTAVDDSEVPPPVGPTKGDRAPAPHVMLVERKIKWTTRSKDRPATSGPTTKIFQLNEAFLKAEGSDVLPFIQRLAPKT